MFHNKKFASDLKGTSLQLLATINVQALLQGTEINTELTFYKVASATPPLCLRHSDIAEVFFDDLQTIITNSFVHQKMLVADSLQWAFDESYTILIDGHAIPNSNYMMDTYGDLHTAGNAPKLNPDLCGELWRWIKLNYVVVLSNPIALNADGAIKIDFDYKGIQNAERVTA